jgi:3-oxoacyl-[acyl-carrier protein] reductase
MTHVAVVTGAAGALGTEIARALARSGDHVLLIDLSAKVEQTAATLRDEGLAASPCISDVSTAAGADIVADAVHALRLPLGKLINNAGINRDARAVKMSDDDFRAVIRVDLVGPALLCESLGGDIADGGSIVNISSRAAFGNFGQVNYVAAKAGLVGLTRALALRLAPRVRVNAVAPGLVDTPMTQGMPSAVLEKLVARIPAGRIGAPSEIASVVAFLASPAASFITGQLLPVCGGRSIA